MGNVYDNGDGHAFKSPLTPAYSVTAPDAGELFYSADFQEALTECQKAALEHGMAYVENNVEDADGDSVNIGCILTVICKTAIIPGYVDPKDMEDKS